MKAKAFAKINLTLDILGKRTDGYHEVETVMQSVSLFDTVTVKLNDSGLFSVDCGDFFSDSENIAITAARRYFEKTGLAFGCDIEIEKNIPVSAGLAGGSADAAAVLRVLNKEFSLLTEEKLLQLGGSLGADIPFCMTGGTVFSFGTGTDILRKRDIPECDIIIVKEGIKPSTAELYRRFDESNVKISRPDTKKMLSAIESGDFKGICENIGNVFAAVWQDETVKRIKQRLLNLGGISVEISGSGPSVFAIFEKEKAKMAEKILVEEGFNAFLCRPESKGVEIIE